MLHGLHPLFGRGMSVLHLTCFTLEEELED